MAVLVLGSLNMDLVVQSPRLPQPGETLQGTQFATIPGGKGANQAVAVARQAVPTVMVGRVGADHYGEALRHALAADGVDVEPVQVDAETHTGVAAIAVAAVGDNQIIIVSGANGQVGSPDLQRLQPYLAQAQYCLLQFEIPPTVVAEAAKMADAAGVTVILDPAPVPQFDVAQVYPHVDILTPNQVEAAQLVGFPVEGVDQARQAIAALQAQGVGTVILKLGAQGVVCGTPQDCLHVPAFAVTAVDTVAAGDAFNGGLAAALHAGQSLREAVRWAAATAALSVTKAGAQPSLPTRSQVAAFLQRQHL